ncbi:cysteine hydrolase [Alicyclobacillus curvatus]|nr:cysteine hydrolase [Alicyclobacillus curvatus]
MSKPAVVVIDMLKSLVYGYPDLQDRLTSVIDPINAVLDKAHQHNIPVIYSNISFRQTANGYDDGGIYEMLDFQNDSLGIPDKVPREALVMGAPGLSIVEELHVHASDFVLRKNRYSAFYGGDIETLLRALDVDTLIVVGIVTNICVRATCMDAFQRGWKTIIPKECVETYSDRAQEQGLEDLAFTTSEVLALADALERL